MGFVGRSGKTTKGTRRTPAAYGRFSRSSAAQAEVVELGRDLTRSGSPLPSRSLSFVLTLGGHWKTLVRVAPTRSHGVAGQGATRVPMLVLDGGIPRPRSLPWRSPTRSARRRHATSIGSAAV